MRQAESRRKVVAYSEEIASQHTADSAVPHAVWWLASSGIALRVVFFIFGDNNGGDALARAEITAGWLQHLSWRLNFEPWLPFHFWLMAGASLLLRNPSLGARVTSLLLGCASLIVLWFLAREIYGASSATFSLIVLTLYSLHIAYSTTSSSEGPYLFFLLGGLLLFFIHRRTGSLAPLIFGAISLGIDSGIRYESWVCIFSLFLVVVAMPRTAGKKELHSTRWRNALVFAAIAGLWPVIWMIYQWTRLASPLYGVTMNYHWVPEQMAVVTRSVLYRFALPPGVLLLTLTPVVVAAAIYGLLVGLRSLRGREFTIVAIIMAAAFLGQIAVGGLLPLARYTITLGTFAAISAGYGFVRFGERLKFAEARRLVYAGVTLLLTLNLAVILALSRSNRSYADKFAAISPLLRFPQHVELVGRYLKPRLKAKDSIVIDDYNVESNIVAASLGLPLVRGSRAFLLSEQPASELPRYIAQYHPDYLIYSSRGVIRSVIPIPSGCKASPISIGSSQFNCVFSDDVYSVYQLTYSSNGGSTEVTLNRRWSKGWQY